MDRRAAPRRDGLLHRQPGDLVPEPQPSAVGGEQPARQQLVDGGRRAAGRRFEQRRLHPGTGQRGDLEQLPGVGAQAGRPGQYGVPGRGRHLGHPGLQDFGHVERVSAGQLVQRGGLQVAAAGQLPHRAGGQGGQADPPGGALPGELAQRDPQLIVRREVVVPEGGNQQDPGLAQPAAANRSRSMVASSAQWTSSTTTTFSGPGPLTWRSRARKSSSLCAPRAHRSSSSPPS